MQCGCSFTDINISYLPLVIFQCPDMFVLNYLVTFPSGFLREESLTAIMPPLLEVKSLCKNLHSLIEILEAYSGINFLSG